MLSDHCPAFLSVCPVRDVGALWPNGWTDQDETWHAGPGDFVLDGDPAPFLKKGGTPPPPNFRPMFIVAKRLDASRFHLVWM